MSFLYASTSAQAYPPIIACENNLPLLVPTLDTVDVDGDNAVMRVGCRGALLLLMGWVVGCWRDEQPAPEPGALPEDFVPAGDEFLVVVLPDTQIYARSFPESFDAQIDWIVEHAEQYNIVFVSHVGDIVHNAEVEAEWLVAREAFERLDQIDMPHGFAVGGHDTSSGANDYSQPVDNSCSPFENTDCDSTHFIQYFGSEKYSSKQWYGGASPSGRSSYQRVQVGDLTLLFLHLLQDTPQQEVDWAHAVLEASSGALAHITTHRYLFDYRMTSTLPSPFNTLLAGRFGAVTYLLGGQSLLFNDGLSADALFADLISVHPNIWGVHCGHVDGEFHQQATNSAGLPVHEILVDFQEMEDGGGGWLRLLKFSPDSDQIEALTYSATTGSVRENGQGFDHALSLLNSYRQSYEADLEAWGIDLDEVDEMLAEISIPGPAQDAFYDDLYKDGARDSRFVMSVDFSAYMEAESP